MKSYKKSKKSKNKKYQVGGNKTVTPPLPASGPELTYPADVTYGQTNLTGDFPTGTPLVTTIPEQFPNLQSKQLDFTQTPGMSNVDTSKVTINPTQNPNPRQVQNPNGDQPIYAYYPAPTVDYSMFDVDLDTPGIQQGPLPKDQQNRQLMTAVELTAQPGEETEDTEKKQRPDYNSMFTLGLAGLSTGLNMNADIQNRRRLQESIQQRDSKPLYDYNFMYGRTSTGGTEYQPIIKAEMGAKIDGRYNTPGMFNNVEIEGGEFLILPDGTTELAQGASHSKGGINTTLPEGTRVFSNHLKPKGSKKTFAKLAKKYDNTQYDEVLNNKFAKQVDKDTALIMKQKNQKVLDKLFMDQQLMNGNSNGETMAKNGASIDNPGFRALPKAVQEQIIANMEYGGYSLPNSLYMQNGAYTPEQWDARVNSPEGREFYGDNLPMNPDMLIKGEEPRYFGSTPGMPNFMAPGKSIQPSFNNPFSAGSAAPSNGNSIGYTPEQWDARVNSPEGREFYGGSPSTTPSAPSTRSVGKSTNQPSSGSTGSNRFPLSNENQKGIETYTQSEIDMIRKYDPTFNPMKGNVPGMQHTVGKVYGSKKNIDIFNRNYDWYLPKFKEQYGRDFNPESKEDVGIAQQAYQDEMTKRFIDVGYTPEEAAEALNKVGFVSKKGLPNSLDQKLGFYTATRELFNPQPKKPPVTPDPDPTPDLVPPVTPTPDPTDDTSITPVEAGRYTRIPYPIDQAIPGMMGLAAAQETFGYAIPEIDAPYLRPQEMNVQSQLQNIDNMTESVIRSGGDPLTAMIKGTTAKEQVYGRKQNYDAGQRGSTDVRNAMMKQQADKFNSAMFNRVYNEMYGPALDAASTERQAAITNMLNNKSKYEQDEQTKEFLSSIYAPNYNYNPNTGRMVVAPQSVSPFSPNYSYGNLSPEDLAAVEEARRKNTQTSVKNTTNSIKRSKQSSKTKSRRK